ncbi:MULTISPECIES: MFS transporter [unclassified Paenibacillus]|uniref:MFS transporter n=2 Tax=Paenibacillus TaxID=44249 RepID=UPI0011A55504|nr:MFS transporter [Paenibacillus sp. Y412MC10]
MVLLIAVWGALFTFALNLTQNWITSAAPEAPEFANGLFVSFSNLGITVGTSVGGLFISGMGTHDVVWAGLMMLVVGFLFITIRVSAFREKASSLN